jgi:HD-GYP domain-containing protein (c-di-GMP phosphodiesterase class II)
MSDLFGHEDLLGGLDAAPDLHTRLAVVHRAVRVFCPFVARIAVALRDPRTEVLKTFVASNPEGLSFVHYETSLEDAPALGEVVRRQRPRIVDDLAWFAQGAHEHTARIREMGFRSSYTGLIRADGAVVGFVFFNAKQPGCFRPEHLDLLDVFVRLIEGQVVRELFGFRAVLAAFRVSLDLVHRRDPDTGNHLERMARYARLIARRLAGSGRYELTDEFIERLHEFARLHDIGKLALPDAVLQKPGPLSSAELDMMRTHTTKGREIVDATIGPLAGPGFASGDLIRNIVEQHHERLDGSGYPRGLQGEAISLEARIVAVADVFDALTSRRPYKEPWPVEEALDYLRAHAGTELDQDCVEALTDEPAAIAEIRRRFPDDAEPIG